MYLSLHSRHLCGNALRYIRPVSEVVSGTRNAFLGIYEIDVFASSIAEEKDNTVVSRWVTASVLNVSHGSHVYAKSERRNRRQVFPGLLISDLSCSVIVHLRATAGHPLLRKGTCRLCVFARISIRSASWRGRVPSAMASTAVRWELHHGFRMFVTLGGAGSWTHHALLRLGYTHLPHYIVLRLV
jgi:hypothetical protein